MTRREWLTKNPPPKAAKALRELLETLVQETNTRPLVESSRATFTQNIQYWNQQAMNARAVQDSATMAHANAQIQDLQNKIADLDKQLAALNQAGVRIANLKTELAAAATCPTHHTDLVRHKNRPEDLFTCEIGPHFFIWTPVGAGAGLSAIDLTKPLPAIDETVTWL